MIALNGTPKHPGIVIAAAAVLDFSQGGPSLPYSIMERALAAVKRQLLPSDQPEVIMVAEQLIVASSFKLPGLQKAALVAESNEDVPGLTVDIPCVIGVSGALAKIESDTIIIVDGNAGKVIVDPDVKTIVDYQQRMEEGRKRARVFIESVHMPAKTQDGYQVTVAARVASLEDLQSAIDHGADTVIADIRLLDPDCQNLISDVMGIAAGKPLTLIPDHLVAPLLQFILRMSVPGQLTLAFNGYEFAEKKAQFEDILQLIKQDGYVEDLPEPALAVIAKTADDTFAAKSSKASIIMERPREELEGAVRKWVKEHKDSKLMVSLGSSLEMLPSVVIAGARTVIVSPGLVEEAKEMVRGLSIEAT